MALWISRFWRRRSRLGADEVAMGCGHISNEVYNQKILEYETTPRSNTVLSRKGGESGERGSFARSGEDLGQRDLPPPMTSSTLPMPTIESDAHLEL